ncbi:hypothetical protein [Segetibacter aerophilus]|uniref:Uncharacterized protein n=1 Tax=Segetibacter aerophilus TaxID=670293 RepID=A0A512B9Y8_9BACT|nr:hypothetical protein [Segetibacter aerophilus]GEO08759.1 hypothetical protein SAE01_12550 [Segetibacter aerophilus]
MSLTITSPKHSFVNFNGGLTDFVIPAYKSVGVAFQFMIDAASLVPIDDAVTVQIADRYNGFLYSHASLVATNLCAWGKLTGLVDADFPGNVLIGPMAGSYPTKQSLFDKINQQFDVGMSEYVFPYCCVNALPFISFTFRNVNNVNKGASVTYYKGLMQVTITENANSLFTAIPSLTECFKYAVVHGSDKVYSNLFRKETNNSYLTKITYSNNEDFAGFGYPNGTAINSVWLPAYLYEPKYPETRKVYRRSDGSYKVQSASIEKEWEMVTDYMPRSMHEKIVIALGHDNIYLLNKEIDSYVSKKDEYDIDWQERVLEAQAKCKVLEPFEARNSNCEKRVSC